MPILLLLLFLFACGQQAEESEDDRSKLILLNQCVVRHQTSVVEHFKSLYHGLYIQPIEVLVQKYYQLDSVISDGLDSVNAMGPATPDSLLFKPALHLFNYYDSACSTLIWNMVLVMERFELEGFDDTYRIKPLADSLRFREEELLLKLTEAQEKAAKEYGLELKN